MIQELRFKNFLSFRDEAFFSFVPTKDEPVNRVAVMADGTKLLRFAVIFGANASGKSNFIQVFDFLREFWKGLPTRKEMQIGVVPFLLDKDTPGQDSTFEMKFYVGDTRYWYKLSLNNERVSDESLLFYESNRPTRIFSRKFVDDKSVVSFNPAAVKLKAAEVDAINLNCWKNMSLFATMSKVNMVIPYVSDVVRWIDEQMLPPINYRTELSSYAKERMLNDEQFLKYLRSFVKTADLRIDDIRVNEMVYSLNDEQLESVSSAPFIDEVSKNEILSKRAISNINTGFVIKVNNARGIEEYVLPEEMQSAGTTRVIELESAIHTTIRNQAFLPLDEIEASLHPLLLDCILNGFLKVENNRSQLLVTTHYDPLLELIDDLFGKDSVWFTEKNEDGNTELYSLLDFKGLNKLTSIRKSYRNGQFGAVPNIFV